MDITIYRGYTEPGYDGDGNWQDGSPKTIATATDVSIQPKSGSERAGETGTKYESEYTAYIMKDNLTFEDGYTEIKQGDNINDKYTVVFPGDWPNSYQSDLKVKSNES
ncbi:hypothetical protein [Halocella sp. SP3-1]|uniref:hypothetical protein n=1 Tax=Halocella sp. SP3-1 TaxID=2382161 RepID=UPI000F75CC0B|nr:hypothetical protein [Halocella sp. SP3-1]AZO96136.1 hypothetical protein D7D81_16920 [Halocella sp. SP3-1]